MPQIPARTTPPSHSQRRRLDDGRDEDNAFRTVGSLDADLPLGTCAAGDMQPPQAMWLGIAVVMLIPIVMVVLNLTLAYPAIRWASIVLAICLVAFNLLVLPYPGAYDSLLIIVGFVFNALTVWYAGRWLA